jgi:hypothetical protein
MVTTPAALSPTNVVDFSDPAVYGLVRRIFFRRFSSRVRAAGIDPDDAIQDIYVGLLTRSKGKSKWDPSRGGLSTWVYVAISGMCINMADSARRRARTTLGVVEDVSDTVSCEADSEITDRVYADMATEMEIPVGVVRALALGADPFCAAMDAGLDFFAANDLATSLGIR